MTPLSLIEHFDKEIHPHEIKLRLQTLEQENFILRSKMELMEITLVGMKNMLSKAMEQSLGES